MTIQTSPHFSFQHSTHSEQPHIPNEINSRKQLN